MRESKDQAGLAGGAKLFCTVTINRQMPVGNMKPHDTFIHDAFNERRIQAGGPGPIIWGKKNLSRRLSCGLSLHEASASNWISGSLSPIAL